LDASAQVNISNASFGQKPVGPAGGSLTGTYPDPTLAPTGVTSGSYIYPSTLSVSAEGRVTAIVAGTAPVNDKAYTHNQLAPSTVWTINHNFGKVPAIQVYDSAGSQVLGYGRDDSNSFNTTTLSFSAQFSGKAFCN